jgi:hypothetical protein
MTFTPEKGMTETVSAFMNDIKRGQSLTTATWDDAAAETTKSRNGNPGHLDKDTMDQILSAYSPHEREMRKYGKPMVGSGLVFPIPEEKITVDRFPIPEYWPRIGGIDFGWDHNTAVVYGAFDPEEDIFYIYDEYALNKRSPSEHAKEIKKRAHFIPISYPHDGNRKDSMGNPGLADQYRNLGCNFLLEHFTNPAALGEKKGGNSVEEGIQRILVALEDGKFKIFRDLDNLLAEYRQYHRKDGKIVPMKDDSMSAMRYCYQSRRFGVAGNDETWTMDFDKPIEYREMGIL